MTPAMQQYMQQQFLLLRLQSLQQSQMPNQQQQQQTDQIQQHQQQQIQQEQQQQQHMQEIRMRQQMITDNERQTGSPDRGKALFKYIDSS